MIRRSFLKFWTVAMGGVTAALLGIPGIAYIIDPRKRIAPPRDFRRVAKLSEVPKPKDGKVVPVQVVVSDSRRDAWTIHPDEVVGRVWLIRQADDSIKAFTSICPHLGCSVNYDAKEHRFLCPCHGGVFDSSGARVPDDVLSRQNPPARGMDALELKLVKIEGTDDAHVEVKYEEFKQGEKTSARKS